MSVRLLSSTMLQSIRDSPNDPADRVPVPADLEALGDRAHDIPGQAHAPLGVMGMRACCARVSAER